MQTLLPYSAYPYFSHCSLSKLSPRVATFVRRVPEHHYVCIPPPHAKYQPSGKIHKVKHRTRQTHFCT
ncbi:hypothetical protein AYI68_g8000 [Smittium mucronatum]|uniref:Uncharacterized protein n=1 Tax=Smittium mucronatum TaxID=133383 RepID=A0A1R0GM47_9FUNG|nr:hypothetical protein AYI68_g8000 [Smittium mucronatum]